MSKLNLIFKNNLLLVVIILICTINIVFAKEQSLVNKVQKPNISNLEIMSDSLTINRLNNTAIFEDNVVITMENMIITTSKVQVIYKDDSESESTQNLQIEKIIMPNKLNAIVGLDEANCNKKQVSNIKNKSTKTNKYDISTSTDNTQENNNEVVIADKGEYNMDEGKLVLTGEVLLMHQDNILKTKKLVYYTAIKQNQDSQ